MSVAYEKAFKINRQIDKDMFDMRKEEPKIEDVVNSEAMMKYLMFLNYLRTIETTISMWKRDVTREYKEYKKGKEIEDNKQGKENKK